MILNFTYVQWISIWINLQWQIDKIGCFQWSFCSIQINKDAQQIEINGFNIQFWQSNCAHLCWWYHVSFGFNRTMDGNSFSNLSLCAIYEAMWTEESSYYLSCNRFLLGALIQYAHLNCKRNQAENTRLNRNHWYYLLFKAVMCWKWLFQCWINSTNESLAVKLEFLKSVQFANKSREWQCKTSPIYEYMTERTEFHSANDRTMNDDIIRNWFYQFKRRTLTELNNPMCERFF